MTKNQDCCRWRLLIMTVIASLNCLCGSLAESAEVVVILPDEITVTRHLVTLKDVSKIICSDPKERTIASELEIADVMDEAHPEEVRASLIRIQLLLGGWSEDEIRIEGAETVRIFFRKPKPLTDDEIEKAATETLASAWDTAVDDLQVKLETGVMNTLPSDIRSMDGLHVEVMTPTTQRLGQIALTVRISSSERMVVAKPFRFVVLRRFRVPVTRVSMSRNQVVSGAAIQFEKRYLSRVADEPEEDAIIGRTVRTDVRAGEILSLRDLNSPVTARTPAAGAASTSPLIIRKKDNVRAIARMGRIQVILQAAEAQQDGRVGDMIRLRNLKSGEIISGRVMPTGHVEVLGR